MVGTSGNTDQTNESTTRRSILRTMGGAGAAATTGIAATGGASAEEESPGPVAQEHGTEVSARKAFGTDLGRQLLGELSDYGYIDTPTFDALGIDTVAAEYDRGLNKLTVVELYDEDMKASPTYIARLRNSRFDGPIVVTFSPEAGVAGAMALRNGERLFLSPLYDFDGFTREALYPDDCRSCSSWHDFCGKNDCDCVVGSQCFDDYPDMRGSRDSHEICDYGNINCGQCTLCCTPCDIDCGGDGCGGGGW